MFKSKSFQIGKVFGIPLMLDWSFLLIFLFITVTLSIDVFPGLNAKWPESYYWIVGVATSLLFFASLIAHETAHSIVSKRTGIPVKSITLFILGGVAQISREASKPKNELFMSIAGPLCSAALGGIFYGLAYLFDGVNIYVSALCAYLSFANLILAVFNMIPGFPMDGGRVLRAIVWMVKKDYVQATRIATTVGYAVAGCFIVGGIFLAFTSWGLFSGLWLVFIGFFIISAARSTNQQLSMRENLKGITAQDVMIRELPRIPRNLNIMDLIDGVLLQSPQQSFFVTDGANIVGVLTTWQVKRVPQNQRSLTTVAQVMIPITALKTVSPTDDALYVLGMMEVSPENLVAVIYNAQVIGIISRESIFGFAQRRQVFRG
jgi:Zn-dependent protease